MPPQLYIAKSGATNPPTLPLDAVTRTFGIYGQRGTGKTNTAVVLVEEMVRKGAHVCVLDPKGDWWGLTRAGAGGKGLPGIVLGGDEGDVPLEETAGQLVADLVVGRHWPVVVVDLGALRKGARRRFTADFLEELYERNREALHLVLEEAHQTVPQTPRDMTPTLGRVLGAAEDIVTLGRKRGLGVSLVSQRFATVNATVREQVETLLLHRLSGPLDRKAAKGWIEANGDAAVTQRILDDLPGFQLGDALMYSPGWLQVLERVRIKARRTFDSSATPEVGAVAATPGERAPVPLDELRSRMAETVQRAERRDPAKLNARIAQLEAQLAAAPAPETIRVPEKVFVPDQVALNAMHERVEAMARFVADFDETVDEIQRAMEGVRVEREQCAELLATLRAGLAEANAAPGERAPARVPEPRLVERGTVWKDGKQIGTIEPAPPPRSNGDRAEGVTGPEQRVLDALAWWATIGVEPVERSRLAFVAGYHERTKGFLNALGSLRGAGRIDYPQPSVVALTDAGRQLAHAPARAPTQAELHERVFEQIGANRARMLRPLIDCFPAALSRPDLAMRLGYHERTKSFLNGLGKLRTLGLIDYPSSGMVRATELLFPAGIRSGAVAAQR